MRDVPADPRFMKYIHRYTSHSSYSHLYIASVRFSRHQLPFLTSTPGTVCIFSSDLYAGNVFSSREPAKFLPKLNHGNHAHSIRIYASVDKLAGGHKRPSGSANPRLFDFYRNANTKASAVVK